MTKTSAIKLVRSRNMNERPFETRPVQFGGIALRHHAADISRKATIEDYANALGFASAAHESAPYWIGDLVSHAENRVDWRDKLDQATSVTGLAEGTLHNLASIARRVAPDERELSPSLDHSAIVASMSKTDQRRWLKKATTEGWNRGEFRVEVRAAQRRGIIDGQADLEGMFRVWYVDPPWAYDNRGDIVVGKSSAYKRAEAHYPTMTIEQLCKMPIAAHAHKNAVLFLWITAPMLLQSPGPRDVIEAWGFTYKASFVWDKVLGNYGHYNHVTHEIVAICTRGSCTPDHPTPSPKSVFVERRSDVHSEKPESFRQQIMKLYDGPYVELFARKRVDGWTTYGNQILEELVEPVKKARA